MKKICTIVLFFLFACQIKASIVIMDGDSGRVLYSENINEKKLIASTTKIMTSIIALENENLDKTIVVGDEIDKVYGSMVYIKKNEEFTVNDLLHGLMLQSGNDAAMVLATNITNYDNFIAQMNIKAYKLGMYDTFFENPHGLNDKTQNISTAYDMALLLKYAIKNKDFISITTTKKYKVKNYIWYNKNKLLTNYKYLITGKIGYTDLSGQVFLSAARKNGKTLIISTIDENDKFNLHKRLYEEYFEKYKRYKILDKLLFSKKVTTNSNDYYYILNDYYMLLNDEELNDIKIKLNINSNFNYVSVYLKDKLIHNEKVYKTKEVQKKNVFEELLLFNK